jgi:hypothetical protein
MTFPKLSCLSFKKKKKKKTVRRWDPAIGKSRSTGHPPPVASVRGRQPWGVTSQPPYPILRPPSCCRPCKPPWKPFAPLAYPYPTRLPLQLLKWSQVWIGMNDTSQNWGLSRLRRSLQASYPVMWKSTQENGARFGVLVLIRRKSSVGGWRPRKKIRPKPLRRGYHTKRSL